MAELFYAKISSINYKKGTADVTLQDREDQVIENVPFLAGFYEMPEPGDVVAAIFEDMDGQIGKGVILGSMFLSKNRPKESGKGIFYKEFSDGACIRYTPETGTLEVTADKLVVRELEATGTAKAKTVETETINAAAINATGDTTVNVLKYNEIYQRE
jgi:phage baseplate assembly protein gpV